MRFEPFGHFFPRRAAISRPAMRFACALPLYEYLNILVSSASGARVCDCPSRVHPRASESYSFSRRIAILCFILFRRTFCEHVDEDGRREKVEIAEKRAARAVHEAVSVVFAGAEGISNPSVDFQGNAADVCLSFQEIQQMRQQIMQVEQQLRTVLSPTYLSTDKEKALQEQQVGLP